MGFGKVTKQLEDAVKIAQSKETLSAVGDYLVDRIKTRTRLGKGVLAPEGKPHSLPKLKDPTKKRRRSDKRAGKLTGPTATPAKSGVNRSGETLESLDYVISGNKIELELSKKGERTASELININKDYTFMNVSAPEVNGAVDIIISEIQKKLK